jgi:hypothetical protein
LADAFRWDKRQGDLGLKENGQQRKRNGASAITMEAAIEEATPPGVLKQPKVLGAGSKVRRSALG